MRSGLPGIARLLLLTERSAAALERTCSGLRGIAVGSAADAAAFSQDASKKGARCGRLLPRWVRFELTAQQAVAKFEAWQASHWLAPSSLLTSPDAQLSARLLPFWLFEAKVRVRYTGRVMRQDAGGAAGADGGGQTRWEQQAWQEVPVRTYPWTRLAMQMYAGYELRPSLAQAAKFEGSVGRSRPLTPSAATEWATVRAMSEPSRSSPPLRVELGTPDMRQAIAWEVALAAIRDQEMALATEALRRRCASPDDTPAHVKDVEVDVKVLRRRARLLYLPVFVVHYVFGQSHNAHGERQDDVFQAVIGGTPEAGVAGERHFCPRKAQITAASALGITGAAASAVAAPLLGLDAAALLTVEGAFLVVLVGTLAGVAARLAPGFLRLSAENQRVQAEAAEFEAAVSGGLGPMDVGDDRQEALRTAAEWRRWALTSPWDWDSAKRRAWAERLWREQHRRRRERARFVDRLRAEAERQRVESEREARRHAKFGGDDARRQSAYFAHGYGSRGYARGVALRDTLGYYKLLGLSPPGLQSSTASQKARGGGVGGEVSAEDVKAAFRRAALRWHPDRVGSGADPAARAKAVAVFQQVQDAYNVLRDPELKRQYDAGQL